MRKWRLNIPWTTVLSVTILGLAAASVGRALASDSPTEPRDHDKLVAKRQAGNPSDEKVFVPEGVWVGGQGVVEPRDRETKVAGGVQGRIARVHVTEGQRVSAGDVLVELDGEVDAASVEVAKAEVLQNEAELMRTKNGERWEDRLASDAEAKVADARAAQSKGILERLRRAQSGGGATGDEVERAAGQAAQDEASAKAAGARRAASYSGSRVEDIRSAEARVAASKARLAEAEARQAQKVVRAPISGEVLSVKVRAGEFYQPGGDALLTLGDTTTLRARIDIDEHDVGSVHVGARVIVRTSANPGVDIEGTVVEIGRRMGRKNVRSDDPVERNDAKVLEVVASLGNRDDLVVGQRLVGFIEAR